MAKKRMATETVPSDRQPEANDQNGIHENGVGKKLPAFKCGPIPTGKGESVQGCVWENEVESNGQVYTVHAIVIEVSYWHQESQEWRLSKSIRPSQLAAYEYVLRRCSDYCFSKRDPQQTVPF